MYCASCGVKLKDSEKVCPLCQTRAYHPDINRVEGESLYPKDKYPLKEMSLKGILAIIAAAFAITAITCLICDLRFSGGVWSGYVIGGLILLYSICILPSWFNDANPVIFVPSNFAGVILFLLYISLATDGKWFLSFAFPVVSALALIVTAVVTLVRYVKGGRLYIFGGMFCLLGLLALLIEFMLDVTFKEITFIGWSFYPLVTFTLIGLFLIFLGICRPAREAVERKFFI